MNKYTFIRTVELISRYEIEACNRESAEIILDTKLENENGNLDKYEFFDSKIDLVNIESIYQAHFDGRNLIVETPSGTAVRSLNEIINELRLEANGGVQ